jgi:hypothetical protein
MGRSGVVFELPPRLQRNRTVPVLHTKTKERAS